MSENSSSGGGAGCFATVMIIIALMTGCNAHERIDTLEVDIQALKGRIATLESRK